MKKRLLSILLTLCMALVLWPARSFAASKSAASLPEGAEQWGGNAYKIYVASATWEEAKWECEQLGGHLATITSPEEQSFIEQLNDSSRRLWIGGYRIENDDWYWVTDEPWDYDNWAAGEPNNSSNVISNENRAAVWPREWNDLNENNTGEQSGFICEWENTSGEDRSYVWKHSGIQPVFTWKQDAKGWWVERRDGTYLVDTWYQSPSGLWYYLGADGYMLQDAVTPDGYRVNADGVWVE